MLRRKRGPPQSGRPWPPMHGDTHPYTPTPYCLGLFALGASVSARGVLRSKAPPSCSSTIMEVIAGVSRGAQDRGWSIGVSKELFFAWLERGFPFPGEHHQTLVFAPPSPFFDNVLCEREFVEPTNSLQLPLSQILQGAAPRTWYAAGKQSRSLLRRGSSNH